jgi:hypothetical protein
LTLFALKFRSGFVIYHDNTFENGTDVLRDHTLMLRVCKIGLEIALRSDSNQKAVGETLVPAARIRPAREFLYFRYEPFQFSQFPDHCCRIRGRGFRFDFKQDHMLDHGHAPFWKQSS